MATVKAHLALWNHDPAAGVVASYEDLLQLWTVGAQVGLIPAGIRRWGTELLEDIAATGGEVEYSMYPNNEH